MAKKLKPKKDGKDGSDQGSEASRETTAEKSRHPKMDTRRESIESVVVAFILAFLFRTFEAEAFVIPTGSMAPTLRGRHKEIECEQCKYRFAIGASDEVEQPGYLLPNRRIEDAICPNCRYVTPGDIVRKLPVFKGDRILVNKFPYEFGDPKRWDVIVFKYPEEPDTNYIKRLVGLPGEKLHIIQGDVYLEGKNRELTILRKDDPEKQRLLQILVYDNDHPADELQKHGWPARWAAVEKKTATNDVAGWSETEQGWESDPETHSFSLNAEGTHRWLRYRHFVPGREDWDAVKRKQKPVNPRPQLIMDFCGYNAYTGGQQGQVVDFGQYWVGDLTLNCEANIEEIEDGAELILELHEGPRTYRCVIDVSSGEASLLQNVPENVAEEEWITLASAETRMKKAGKFRLTFANVDHRLCLWINDKLIDFGTDDDGIEKNRYKRHGPRGYTYPMETDLTPVGIAAKGLSLKVSHLLLQRDIYYRGEHVENDALNWDRPPTHYEYQGHRENSIPITLSKLVHDPRGWWEEYRQHRQPAVFERLGDNEYFVMGDNSPRSKDSRLWPNAYRNAKHRHAVPRSNLVGKAFYIYWPHGVPFMNNGQGYPFTYHRTINGKKTDYPNMRIPFYPDFKRMRRIR
ncbi:MAG: signal peptidase I [Planctomycetaceae bacterium]